MTRSSSRRRRSNRSERCRSPARSATCASLTASPTSARLLIWAASRASGGWLFSAARHSERRERFPSPSLWNLGRAKLLSELACPGFLVYRRKLTADFPLLKDAVLDH